MHWNEIGRDSLRAARAIQDSNARSSISRAYYAAHSVLTEALLNAGYVPPRARQTPPHMLQPALIGQFLNGKGERVVRELRVTVRRLYAARLDADYNRRVTIDSGVSLQAVRDAHAMFLMLEVNP